MDRFRRRNAVLPLLLILAPPMKLAGAFSAPTPNQFASSVRSIAEETTTPIISSPVQPEEVEASRRTFLSGAVAAAVATTSFVASPPEANAASSTEFADTDTAATTSLLASTAAPTVDWQGILQKSSKKALGGGKAGASAAVVQVVGLMWLRTAMNYQYRYGGDLGSSLNKLWGDGGLPRLYQGLPFAIVQGPLTRFGDTAANVGILALLESFEATASLPLPVKTACGSAAAGLWRIICMPIDSSKTAMQVEGSDGLRRLWDKVGEQGPSPLYQGALASAAATAVGHFPWFLTFNFLNDKLPSVSSDDDLLLALARAAFVGLCASCVSDCTSNSLRVIKTTKQTGALSGDDNGKSELSYKETLDLILKEDGVAGLFGRGLQTRLLSNAVQGAAFSVLWKYFQQAG